MKYIALVSLLSAFLITGCSESPKEEQPAEDYVTEDQQNELPAGEPITLHARLDFVDTQATPSINASRQLKASFYLTTDVMRDGAADGASFWADGENYRVQGAIAASGNFSLNSSDVATDETYNMSNQWPSVTENPEGTFRIKMPEASLIGEGLSVGVEIEVPVKGTKKATITGNGQTIDSELSHARTMFCHSKSDEEEACKLEFTIDAVPTKAKDSTYDHLLQSAKDAFAFQGKQGPDGGLIIYSSLLPVYGATTRYHNGHFVTSLKQEYSVNLDGSELGQQIHMVVWSTKRGDNWQPEEATPVKIPE